MLQVLETLHLMCILTHFITNFKLYLKKIQKRKNSLFIFA
ncbi:unnamed protein product [Tenebrio molitor]|nr:unnamed protein product [Tenebrio molitor]